MIPARTLAACIEAAENEIVELEDDRQYFECCLHLPPSDPDYQDRRRLPDIIRRLNHARNCLNQLRLIAKNEPAVDLTCKHYAIRPAPQ